MNTSLDSLTLAQLQRALQIKQQIEAARQELDTLLGKAHALPAPMPQAAPTASPASGRGKQTRTPELRDSLATTQKVRGSKQESEPAPPAPMSAKELFAAQHRLSNAGRAKVLAAINARWARTRLGS